MEQPNTLQQKWKNCCPSYRLPLNSETGAIFMIVYNLFFALAYFSCIPKLLNYENTTGFAFIILIVLYPIVGYVADCWIGKYTVIRFALYALVLSIIVTGISTIIITSTPLLYIAIGILNFSFACFLSCIIHFTTDQLIGASGEQLSFAVYWLIWGLMAGTLIGYDMQYVLKHRLAQVLFGISSVSVLVAVCMMECCNQWIKTKFQLSNNPFSHVVKVLSYARKHKYPERRNAISYWEEDNPSRIDLAKDQYGGPFTVEEVEDVKTIFRLIPVIVSITSCAITLWTKRRLASTANTLNWFSYNSFQSSVMLAGLMSMFGLPIHQFLIYPFLYNYIPSMLKRLGIGMLLLMASLLSSSVMEYTHSNNSTANFTCNGSTQNIANQGWEMVTISLDGVSGLLVLYSLVEFVMAQTPYKSRGVMLCFAFGSLGFFASIGLGLDQVLKMLPAKHCGFYNYITYFFIVLVAFILFVFISTWYQSHKRGDHLLQYISIKDYSENRDEQEWDLFLN